MNRRRVRRPQVAQLASSYSACGYKSASGRTFDGNGNVIGLIDMATGLKSATYDYNAFGETIQSDGVAALANHFRFSTKYADDETGLNYYGFRFYQPTTGRWLSRDPIEERGGLNVNCFISNAAVNGIDTEGLYTRTAPLTNPFVAPPVAPPMGPNPLLGGLAIAGLTAPTSLGDAEIHDDQFSLYQEISRQAAEKRQSACCAECVDSLDIANIQPFETRGSYGHHFEVRIGLHGIPTEGGGEARLEWNERTN